MLEVDLGELSTLALYSTLHHTEPATCQEVPPATGENITVPGEYCGDPPLSTQAHETVPEVDLGDSSCRSFYIDLDKAEPHVEVPSPSA